MSRKSIVFALLVLLSLLASSCAGGPQVVQTGEIGYTPNQQFTPGNEQDPYTQLFRPGDSVGSQDIVEPIADVPQGQFGLYKGQILPSGQYREIAQSWVLLVPAAVVQTGLVAVYRESQTKYRILSQGTYNIDVSQTLLFPAGVLRYRTLRPDLLTNPDACASFKCETTLTGASVNDNPVGANVDVDVSFRFVYTDDTAKALWEMASADAATQIFIGSPLRAARAMSSGLTQNDILSADGRARLADIYKGIIDKAVAGQPIEILAVFIRGVEIGDQAYRDSQSAAQSEVEKERLEGERLQQQQENLQLRQSIEATQSAFGRQQAELDAESQAKVLRTIFSATTGQDPEVVRAVLQVMFPGAIITVTPTAPAP